MNLETLRIILWIVAGSLMILGVGGVALGLWLSKRGGGAERADRQRPIPYAREQTVPPSPSLAAGAETRVAPRPVEAAVLTARQAAYRLGILVFVALAVLTAVEFWIASVAHGSMVLLGLIALVKAGLIVQYYMHLRSVWGEEESHR